MPHAGPPGTPKEVAAYLRKSEGTLANWRCAGIGPPYVKVAGTIRYRWADIEKWLASRVIDPSGRTA